jgi:hypothetical protein
MRSNLWAMRTKKPPEIVESARLPRLQRRALYVVSALLWISGACWLYFSYFASDGANLSAPSRAPALLPELHGAAAMAFLLVFGTLLPQHLPNGWHQKRQRSSGLSLVVVCAILVLTGWGLYYLSDESLRTATRVTHSTLGVVLPLAMAAHVWRARLRSRLDAPQSRRDDPSYPAVSSAGR